MKIFQTTVVTTKLQEQQQVWTSWTSIAVGYNVHVANDFMNN